MGVTYKDCGVTFAENNLCSVYQGWGTCNIGTYTIENDKLICNTVISRCEEGGISYSEENIVYEFEIIDEDTIKLVKVTDHTGNGYLKDGLTEGMTYSFSGKKGVVLISEFSNGEIILEGTYTTIDSQNVQIYMDEMIVWDDDHSGNTT